MLMQDKNGNTIRKGDVVKIEGGYFKTDNGMYKVNHAPGDNDWSGKDYAMIKINRKGSIACPNSHTKIGFWPLMVTVNSREKRIEANAHNAEHATIEIIKIER